MSQDNNELDAIIENLRTFKSLSQKNVKFIVTKAK